MQAPSAGFWEQLAGPARTLLFLGLAGSGKSTILQWLAQEQITIKPTQVRTAHLCPGCASKFGWRIGYHGLNDELGDRALTSKALDPSHAKKWAAARLPTGATTSMALTHW